MYESGERRKEVKERWEEDVGKEEGRGPWGPPFIAFEEGKNRERGYGLRGCKPGNSRRYAGVLRFSGPGLPGDGFIYGTGR